MGHSCFAHRELAAQKDVQYSSFVTSFKPGKEIQRAKTCTTNTVFAQPWSSRTTAMVVLSFFHGQRPKADATKCLARTMCTVELNRGHSTHTAPTRRTAVSVRQALNTSLCRWYHYLGVPKRGEAPACSWTVREGTLSMYSTVLDRGLPFHEPPLLTQRTPPTTGRRGSSGDTPGGIYFFCIERFMSAQKGVTVIFQI